MEHTKGPWEQVGNEVRSSTDAILFGSTSPNGAPYDDQRAAMSHAVACVNACDSAGIVEPGELTVLMTAAETMVREMQRRIDGLFADNLDDGITLQQESLTSSLRAALAAVRGE